MATTTKKTVKVVRNIGTLSLTEDGRWVGDGSIIDDEKISPCNLIKLTVDIIQREWEADKKDLTKCTAIQLLNGALAKIDE